MGSDAPDPPEMSQEEKDILDSQTKLLDQSSMMMRMLMPGMLGMQGYTWDSKLGTIRRMSQAEQMKNMTPEQRMIMRAEMGAFRNMENAMDPESYYNPGLELSLADSEAQLMEAIGTKGGAMAMLGTPGIQAMSEFGAQSAAVREDTRKADIGFYGDVGGAMASLGAGLNTQALGNLANTATLPAQAAQGYSGLAQPYQYYAGLGYQGDMAAYNANQSGLGALGGGAMMLGMGGLMGIEGLAAFGGPVGWGLLGAGAIAGLL